MKFKLSLLNLLIYYLSDLGSEAALSLKLRELFKLQSDTISVEDFRAKIRLHVERASCHEIL